MTTTQQFFLRWNNYLQHITYAFDSLRSHEDLVDVTLCCEGRKIRAHKILLSACSSYFKEIFKENPCQHPVIVFKNVKYDDLLAIIEFMYQGEVNVQQDYLPSFLNTAEMLSVQGLTEGGDKPPGKTVNETSQTSTITIPIVQQQSQQQQTETIEVQEITLGTPETTSSVLTEQQPSTISVDANVQTIQIDEGNIDEHLTFHKISTIDEATNTSTIYIAPLVAEVNKTTTATTTPAIATSVVNAIQIPRLISTETIVSDIIKTKMEQSDQDGEEILSENEIVLETYEEAGNDFMKMEIPEYVSQEATQFRTTTLDDGTVIDVEQIEIDGKTTGKTSATSSATTTTTAFVTSKDGTKEIDEDFPVPVDRKCSYCNKQFTARAALRRHIHSRHTNVIGNCTCPVCEKVYKTKWSLSTHLSRFHRN